MKRVENIVVGTRVRRGPDWKWGNQDKWDFDKQVNPNATGLGTIIGKTDGGWATVAWDSGSSERNYRVGHRNSYDLSYAEPETDLLLKVLEL